MPEMITATELLRDAKRILLGGRWTKGTLARSRDGAEIMPWKVEACRFCLVGALARAYFERTGDTDLVPMRDIPALKEALARLASAIRHRTGHRYQGKGLAWIAGSFNDSSRTFYDDVLDVLSEATGEGGDGGNTHG
jgi:hypothetical protein